MIVKSYTPPAEVAPELEKSIEHPVRDSDVPGTVVAILQGLMLPKSPSRDRQPSNQS